MGQSIKDISNSTVAGSNIDGINNSVKDVSVNKAETSSLVGRKKNCFGFNHDSSNRDFLLIGAFVLSLLSGAVVLFFLCTRFPRCENLQFDYIGVILGMLSFLVTILIAWQIFLALGVYDKMKYITKKLDNDIKPMNTRIDECEKLISSLKNEMKSFKIEVNESMDDRIEKYNKMTTTRGYIIREIEKMNNNEKLYGKEVFKDHINLIERFGKLDLDDYSNCSIINRVLFVIYMSKEKREEITLTQEEHDRYIGIVKSSNEEIRDGLLESISKLKIEA